MISIIEEDKPDKNWNKRLLESGLGTIYQTTERAVYVKKTDVPTKFLKFFDNSGEIIGQLLITFQPRFHTKGMRNLILKKTPFLNQTICNWAYGPIVFDTELYSEIYSTLHSFLKSNNLTVKAWTHPLLPGNPTTLAKHFQIRKWGTYIINLQKDIDELYGNIEKHSGQKNIQRSIKRGVIVEELTENTLVDYIDLLNETRKEGPADLEYFKYRWKIFQPLGYSGFIARKDGEPVGGLLFSFVNGHIIEIGVARSKKDTLEKLYSQDLIKWKIIEWGKKNNMKYYDLTGFNPNPISKKEEGIQKYKRKWGGKAHYYYRILQKPNIFTKRT